MASTRRPAEPHKNPLPSPNHQPTCPVVTGLSPWTAVLADSLGGEWFLPVEASAAVAGVEARGFPRPQPRPSPARMAPLFISHCTLLI